MDITQIVVALIGLLSAVVTGFLIPVLRSKLTDHQQMVFTSVVKAGVYAAEQIFGADGIGKEKRHFVEKYLQEKGYEINNDDVDIAIESAVKELKINLG